MYKEKPGRVYGAIPVFFLYCCKKNQTLKDGIKANKAYLFFRSGNHRTNLAKIGL